MPKSPETSLNFYDFPYTLLINFLFKFMYSLGYTPNTPLYQKHYRKMGTHSRSGAGRPVGSKSGCTLKMITDSCKTLSAEQRRKVMEYAERVSSGSSDSEEEVEFEVADPELPYRVEFSPLTFVHDNCYYVNHPVGRRR